MIRRVRARAVPTATNRRVGVLSERLIIQLVFWLLLACVVPYALLSAVDNESSGRVWTAMGPLLICAVSAARLTSLGSRAEARPILATFYVFVYIFLGLAPCLQQIIGFYPWFNTAVGSYSQSSTMLSYAVIGVGLVGAEAGYRWVSARNNRMALLQNNVLGRALDERRIFIVMCLAAVATPLLVVVNGGFGQLFVPRLEASDRRLYAIGGEGLARYLVVSVALTLPLVTAYFGSLAELMAGRRSGAAASHRLVLQAVVLGCLTVVFNNPISTARFWIGTIVTTTVLICWPWHRRAASGLVIAALLVGLIVVFPLSDLYRYTMDTNLAERTAASGVAKELGEKADYDSFQQILNSVSFVESSGTTNGRQLLGSLLFWVPRSVWSNKPVSTAELVATEQRYAFTNLSMPLWGEFYVDGGLPLVLVGFVFYGALIGGLDRGFSRGSSESRGTRMLLCCTWAAYQMFLLRGSLMVAMSWLLPMLLCLVAITKRVPATSEAGSVIIRTRLPFRLSVRSNGLVSSYSHKR
jgi:hypothetical protein